MPLQNPGFEDAGARPGEAAFWTLFTVVANERIAGFGPEPHRAWEDFERWFERQVAFDDGDLVPATFGPIANRSEDFEAAWSNVPYLTELPTGQLVTFRFGGGNCEAFDMGWSNEVFAFTWDAVDAMTGIFNGKPRESFDTQWSSNQTFAQTWEAVASRSARFDAGAQDRETFDHQWTPATTF
jgi:hypothetical protein